MLNVRELDLAFIQSEQKVSQNMLKKRMMVSNAYYGRVKDDEEFPLHSGTRIKQHRLGRVGIENTGWRPVDDELCETHVDESLPDMIEHGSSEFYFSLVQKDMATRTINLASLALRAYPEEEIKQLEEGLQNASRYVNESFRRDRYSFFCENKIVGIVGESGGDPISTFEGSMDNVLNNGWLYELRANGEMDEGFVRVCCDPGNDGAAGLRFISEVSADLMESAAVALQHEGAPFLGDTLMFDTVFADKSMVRRIEMHEDELVNNAATRGCYDMLELSREYGVTATIRDQYAVRFDLHAARFYPDATFNAALVAQGGYAFDAEDPETWPRFQRIYPLVKKRDTRGVQYVVDQKYLTAPFGISTIFNPRVMDVMSFPPMMGAGSAQKDKDWGGFGYDGIAKWTNIRDPKYNKHGEKGNWELRFRLAARPQFSEEGYSFFHRIYRGVNLRATTLPIGTPSIHAEVTPFCVGQFGGAHHSANGPNVPISHNANGEIDLTA